MPGTTGGRRANWTPLLVLLLVAGLFVLPVAGQVPARPTAWVPVISTVPPPVPVAPVEPASGEGHPRDATPWPTVRETPRPPTPTPVPPPPPPSPEPTGTRVTLTFTYIPLPTTPSLETTRTTAAPIPPIVTETYRRAGSTTSITFFTALGAAFLLLHRRR